MRGRIRIGIAALAVLAMARPDSAAAQAAGNLPNPAIAECSRHQGNLFGGVDVRRLFRAPSGDFTVLLPGRDWCEVSSADVVPYTFLGLRLLARLRWSRPDAGPEEAGAVQVQVLPLPWPVGRPIPTPETLRDGILALRRGQPLPAGTEGLRNLLEDAAREHGGDMTITEAASRCLRLQGGRDLQGATPGARPLRAEVETRYCFARQGGAAAFVSVATTAPAGDRVASEAVASMRERVLASVHFEPLSAGVSPDCRTVQAWFERSFPACAATAGVVPEPGAAGAVDAAMGCLAGGLSTARLGVGQQRRCFAEVLRDAGFRDALPLDLLERLRRAEER